MGTSIIMLIVCWLCGGIFLSIGIWALRRKTPIHFYSGSTVSPDEIRDIPAYNRANGRMWNLYSLLYFLAGILAFWKPGLAGILIGAACFPGMFFLILAYHRIYRKYAIKQ